MAYYYYRDYFSIDFIINYYIVEMYCSYSGLSNPHKNTNSFVMLVLIVTFNFYLREGWKAVGR